MIGAAVENFPAGKYRTIYIDPPWPERGGVRYAGEQTVIIP